MVRFLTAVTASFLGGGFASAAFNVTSWTGHTASSVAECAPQKSSFVAGEFKPFKFLSSQYESYDTRRLHFALETPSTPFAMPVSSCVVFKITDADGKDVLQPFTPITANGTNGHFQVVVKMRPKDKMSSHLFQMQPGEEVLIQGPFEKFAYKPNMWKHVGMLAGGTGIAPMYQLLQEILANPKDKTHVSLVYANNQRRDILFGNELATLLKTYNNFNLYLTLLEVPTRWMGGIGYINESIIKTFMPKPGENGTKILVAGPPPMLSAVAGDKLYAPNKAPQQGPLQGMLRKMGYTEAQVFKF